MDSFIGLSIVGIDTTAKVSTEQINTRYIKKVRAVSTSEALVFTTANSVVILETKPYLEEAKDHLYFSDSTVSAVTAAANSTIPGSSTSGQVALVAGTKAITVPGVTTSSKAFVSLVSPSSASLTVDTQAVCTANTVTITALVAAKTINTADVSTVNYLVI